MEEFRSDIQKVLKPTAAFSQLNSNMELFTSFSELNQPLSSHILDYFSSNNVINNADTTQPPYSNEQLEFNFVEDSAIAHSLLCVSDQTHSTAVQLSSDFRSEAGPNNRIDQNNVLSAFFGLS